MTDLIDVTATRIHAVVNQHGSITLSNLEYAIDASYNLIFLAVERLVTTGKLNLRKGEWDYIVSAPLNDTEQRTYVTSTE